MKKLTEKIKAQLNKKNMPYFIAAIAVAIADDALPVSAIPLYLDWD